MSRDEFYLLVHAINKKADVMDEYDRLTAERDVAVRQNAEMFDILKNGDDVIAQLTAELAVFSAWEPELDELHRRMAIESVQAQAERDAACAGKVSLQGYIEYLKRSLEDVRSYIRDDQMGTARELLDILIDSDLMAVGK